MLKGPTDLDWVERDHTFEDEVEGGCRRRRSSRRPGGPAQPGGSCRFERVLDRIEMEN